MESGAGFGPYILGVGSGDGDESPGFSSKKLFNLLKNSRQDNQGISTLKDSEITCIAELLKKANLLNSQFQSVFFFFFFFFTLIPT